MREVPKLGLIGRSVATAYSFRVNKPLGGWAIATVNDGTGELSIQSDWGNWSHRWSADPSDLGSPTLTHFIADRHACDYLAGKLLGRSSCYEWDREATVREFRQRLVERRLDRGRRYAATPACLRDPDYLEPIYRDGRRTLSRENARELWDLLGELEHAHDEREFIERFMANGDLCRWVSEQVFDETQSKPSREYEILTGSILPALVAACASEVKRRVEIAADVSPIAPAGAP